jgi:NitT/TauT family transport system substrate-binding protein
VTTIRRSHFLAAACCTAAYASFARSARAAATPVRIMGNPNDDSTSLYYAMRSGMFDRAGLNVTIDVGTSGAAVAAAVLGGSYDVGKSSITSILEAHEKGIPFTLLAPASIQEPATPFAATLTLRDGPVATGKDLEGQIVGLSSLSSIGRAAVCSWVEKTGGNWRAVQFVEIPLTQAAAAVSQKRVVASEIAQPLLAAALTSGSFRTLPTYDTLAPRFALTVWFTTRAWSSKQSDAARAFATTIARSAVFTNSHHADTAPVMAQASGVDLAVIQAMPRVVNGTTLEPAQLQPIIDASTKYGILKASFPARDIIDPNAVVR